MPSHSEIFNVYDEALLDKQSNKNNARKSYIINIKGRKDSESIVLRQTKYNLWLSSKQTQISDGWHWQCDIEHLLYIQEVSIAMIGHIPSLTRHFSLP